MPKFAHLVSAVLLAGATMFANATPVHSLGDQTPTGFATNSNFSGNARGWEFTAGVANISVSQLGIDAASGGSYTLTLWDVATQSVLAQSTIANAVAGAWNWVDLATSVSLVAGQQYMVMGIGNGSGQSYYYQSVGSSWKPTGDINYVTMEYCNSCTANTFADSTLAGYQYGLVDIGYTVGTVPEPSSLAILAIGLMAFGAVYRKKKSA